MRPARSATRRLATSGLLTLVVGALVAGAGCSSSAQPPPAAGEPSRSHPKVTPPRWSAACDPLVPYHCGFPFPSNTALKDDPSTPTKKRVAFDAAALPQHGGAPTDPSTWSRADGFSPNMNLVTDLPYATSTGLPDEHHLADSITAGSPTILLDTSTGALVPHIAELDVRAKSEDEVGYPNQAFMIRPVVRLKSATRYVVAIRHVVDDAGVALDPSPEFRNLRDGAPSSEPSIEARRALYDDVFARLAKAGVDRADLQLAWDFSTASREGDTGDLLAMRDAALAAFDQDDPSVYTIDAIVDDPNVHVRRRLVGHVKVPCFLDDCGLGTSSAPVMPSIHRDAAGKITQNGTYSLAFEVQIPKSVVADGAPPGPILQNGHGLLGVKEQGRDTYLARIANKSSMVTVVTDLQGMAQEDNDARYGQALTTAISGDIGAFRHLVARQHMGLVNELLAMRMMQGAFARDAKLSELTSDRRSPIDPTRRYYRGDSQGGIFGATYLAISTDVERGVLDVAGAPFSLLLHRSSDFNPFFFVLGLHYADSLDVQLALGLVQMLWDHTEPGGYAPYLTENTLPGTPPHHALLEAAIGDFQVTTLGAHLLARTIGAKNLRPVNREIFQVPSADGPFAGNGLIEWDFGVPPVPTGNEPPYSGLDPHGFIRGTDVSIETEAEFLRNGVVKNLCGGPCKGE